MSPIRSVLITLAALGLLSACGAEEGNGFVVSEDRQVKDFTKVKVADGLSVEIVLGDRRVTITTDDNLMEEFKVDVDGETLKISRQAGDIEPTVARIVISTPVLEALEATDRSQVSAQATQSEEWRLTVKDRSNVAITGITATRFYIDSRDESRVEAFGLTRDINIDCHGSSVVNADGVSAGNAKVDVSGGSLVNVNATNEIEIDAAGNSRILVSGNAPSRNLDADNGSEIVFLNQ